MWKNHLKIAVKVLLRRKFITAVSLLGIGFTLTVLMVAAALVDHRIGPCPPETRGDRLLKVTGACLVNEDFYKEGSGSVSAGGLGFGLVRHVKKLQTPEKIAVYENNRQQATYQGGEKRLLDVKATDAAYWEIMEFDFLEGRPFTADEVAGMSAVAVIDRKTGAALFPGRPAVGQMLETIEKQYRVVGVVPTVPEGSRKSVKADIWVPLKPYHPGMAHAFLGGLNLLLLARSPSDFPAIRREFGAMLEAIDLSSHPWAYFINAFPKTELDDIAIGGSVSFVMRSDMAAMLQALPGLRSRLIRSALGVVLLFMAVTSLSLVNLNVSRIMERASEIGVRKSFGATSVQLVRQFLIENLVLTMVGGLIGFCVSYGILEYRMGLTAGIPDDFGMNYRLFLAGFLFTLFFGLLSGIYPAWRMSRLHPAEALKGGRR